MAIGDGCGTRFLGRLCSGGPDVAGEGSPVCHCNNCLDEEPPSVVARLRSKTRVMHPKFLCSLGSNT